MTLTFQDHNLEKKSHFGHFGPFKNLKTILSGLNVRSTWSYVGHHYAKQPLRSKIWIKVLSMKMHAFNVSESDGAICFYLWPWPSKFIIKTKYQMFTHGTSCVYHGTPMVSNSNLMGFPWPTWGIFRDDDLWNSTFWAITQLLISKMLPNCHIR